MQRTRQWPRLARWHVNRIHSGVDTWFSWGFDRAPVHFAAFWYAASLESPCQRHGQIVPRDVILDWILHRQTVILWTAGESMTKRSIHLMSLVAGCLLLALTTTARAQTGATNAPIPIANATATAESTEGHCAQALDRAAAEGLFQRAIELQKEGKLDVACDKYEESNRLEHDVSILVRLARCRKTQGKLATAWALFKTATKLATIQGHTDLVEPLTQYSNELEAELSHLTIHVAELVPGLDIRRDKVAVGRAQFDESLPIDPGDHEITASAPGFESTELHVHVGEKADSQVITVPALRRLAPPPVPSATRPQPQARANPWPWVLGGVGATAFLVGGTSAVMAVVTQHKASECASQTSSCSDKTLWRTESRRDVATNVAWVSLPIGVAALGAATWMLLDSKQPEHPELSSARNILSVTADNRGGRLWLEGSF